METIRLDKCLAMNFGCSRREAGILIRKGRVTVNGNFVRDAALKVSPDDAVCCDDSDLQVVTKASPRYFMLNKPVGCVSATDDSEYPTVMSCLRDEAGGLFPVGRRDLDTEGLIFITDDGAWAHRVTAPSRKCPKVYEAVLEQPLDPALKEIFAKGVLLRGEKTPTLPAELEILEPEKVRLTIHEGRYHQVKRMFASQGNHVVALRRIAIGGIFLPGDLAPGDYRPLTPEEIALF